MNLLLDTHVFLWWVKGSKKLPAAVQEALSDSTNEVFLSAASVWEIAIKAKIGKLKLAVSPHDFVAKHLRINNISQLVITSQHATATYELELHHSDPFDRLIVAQALIEQLTLITADPKLRVYPVATLWQ